MKIKHHKKSFKYASELKKECPKPSKDDASAYPSFNPYNNIVEQSNLPQVTQEDKKIFDEMLNISQFERYNNWYEKFVPSKDELSEAQKKAFLMVYDNFFLVYQKIKKAFPNTAFSIALSGGAVRDMLFLKDAPIKDLDFCVDLIKFKRMNDLHRDKKNTSKSFFAEDSEDFTSEYRNETEYKELLSSLEFRKAIYTPKEYQTVLDSLEHSSLLKFKFKQSGENVEAVYWGLGDLEQKLQQKEITWDEYCNDHLEATIKTEGINGMPIDLLFSQNSVDDIINSFDFCICQSHILISNLTDKMPELYTDDDKIDFIFQHLIVPIHTLKDLHENRCSIVKRYKHNPEKINYFVFNHFPRIEKKFPNLKLRLYYHYENEEAERIFNSINQNKVLEQLLHKYPDSIEIETTSDKLESKDDSFKI